MQLLEKKYKGQLDEQADRWIEYAVGGATRMQTLINDLLVYSRVGTHGHAFNTFASKEVLSNALKNLHLVVAESGAEPSPILCILRILSAAVVHISCCEIGGVGGITGLGG